VSMRRSFVVLGLCVAVCGCATKHYAYDWGNYDPSLYAYYKDPTKMAKLEDELAVIVKAGDANGMTVPPGIYAEYGYLKLQQGQSDAAIDMFTQEKKRWPESTVFMDNMIKVASVPASSSPTKGQAPR
jgi:hypothetical protein